MIVSRMWRHRARKRNRGCGEQIERVVDAMRYGFRWGPLDVIRAAVIRDRRCVQVRTERNTVEVAVSPQGNNVQVWVNNERVY